MARLYKVSKKIPDDEDDVSNAETGQQHREHIPHTPDRKSIFKVKKHCELVFVQCSYIANYHVYSAAVLQIITFTVQQH